MGKKQLLVNGFIKLISGAVLLALLLFLPAGTFDFPGAWRMIAVLFIPMFILGAALLLLSPELLEKRLRTKETQPEQKTTILFSSLMFISCFLLCGFDFRFSLTHIPAWLTYAGCIIFLLTYFGYAELLRENKYLSRTVEVQDNQHVVSTGLYGIVRHPMYFIITFMFLSMPVIIGSVLGIIPLLFLPVILIKRIKNEEKVLETGLNGYSEYMLKVKYRLIPFIW